MGKLKYVIAGAGGVGGSIAAMLYLAGEDVTCIARDSHLKALQQEGLHYHSDLKGEHVLPIPALSADDYQDKADVIFVCVKGYSISSILDMITRASHAHTLVIPILNVYGTGPKIASLLPDNIEVLDGCIYIVGYKNAPGHITQMGKVFRIVYGSRQSTPALELQMKEVGAALEHSGIKVNISDDINRDTFVKWSFISAMAVTGMYYDCTMQSVQENPEIRQTFIGLSEESYALGKKLGIAFKEDQVTYNLRVMDSLDPNSTASMQKDMKAGHETEIQGQLFDLITLAEENGVDIPTYKMVAKKFQ